MELIYNIFIGGRGHTHSQLTSSVDRREVDFRTRGATCSLGGAITPASSLLVEYLPHGSSVLMDEATCSAWLQGVDEQAHPWNYSGAALEQGCPALAAPRRSGGSLPPAVSRMASRRGLAPGSSECFVVLRWRGFGFVPLSLCCLMSRLALCAVPDSVWCLLRHTRREGRG